jgi:hypothetical protein
VYRTQADAELARQFTLGNLRICFNQAQRPQLGILPRQRRPACHVSFANLQLPHRVSIALRGHIALANLEREFATFIFELIACAQPAARHFPLFGV